MTDEERREMMRRNYAAQMAMLGYDASGNMLDKVLVVRCKDCIYYNDGGRELPVCENLGKLFIHKRGDWYCADGERRENE